MSKPVQEAPLLPPSEGFNRAHRNMLEYVKRQDKIQRWVNNVVIGGLLALYLARRWYKRGKK